MTKDPWDGDPMRPMSYNPWLYAYANPLRFTDPSGKIACELLPPEDQAGCGQGGGGTGGSGTNPPPPLPPGGLPYCTSNTVAAGEPCIPLPCANDGPGGGSGVPDPVPFPQEHCDELWCEVVKPLRNWGEVSGFRYPEKAVGARLLLAELGARIINNGNWKSEGIAILWTVKNRVVWNNEYLSGHPQRATTFSSCELGFIVCSTSGTQYATGSTTRGLDPLYFDPDKPQKRRSYYEKIEYVSIAVQRAIDVATQVFDKKVSDPTSGAHHFSHLYGPTTFARQVDYDSNGNLITNFNPETGWVEIGYHLHTLSIPYIYSPP